MCIVRLNFRNEICCTIEDGLVVHKVYWNRDLRCFTSAMSAAAKS